MQQVVTINLNGRAYQFDEDAYEAIHAYLDREEMAPVEATSDSAEQKPGPQGGDCGLQRNRQNVGGERRVESSQRLSGWSSDDGAAGAELRSVTFALKD